MKYLILIIGLVFLAGCEGEEHTSITVNADDSSNVQISSSGEIIAGEGEVEEEAPKTGETTKEELEALLIQIDAGLI